MPRVSFTANLARHAPCPPRIVAGATLSEALDGAFAESPLLRTYVLDDQGRLRKHVIIFINGEPSRDRTTLSDPLGAGDEIYVFQALSGG